MQCTLQELEPGQAAAAAPAQRCATEDLAAGVSEGPKVLLGGVDALLASIATLTARPPVYAVASTTALLGLHAAACMARGVPLGPWAVQAARRLAAAQAQADAQAPTAAAAADLQPLVLLDLSPPGGSCSWGRLYRALHQPHSLSQRQHAPQPQQGSHLRNEERLHGGSAQPFEPARWFVLHWWPEECRGVGEPMPSSGRLEPLKSFAARFDPGPRPGSKLWHGSASVSEPRVGKEAAAASKTRAWCEDGPGAGAAADRGPAHGPCAEGNMEEGEGAVGAGTELPAAAAAHPVQDSQSLPCPQHGVHLCGQAHSGQVVRVADIGAGHPATAAASCAPGASTRCWEAPRWGVPPGNHVWPGSQPPARVHQALPPSGLSPPSSPPPATSPPAELRVPGEAELLEILLVLPHPPHSSIGQQCGPLAGLPAFLSALGSGGLGEGPLLPLAQWSGEHGQEASDVGDGARAYTLQLRRLAELGRTGGGLLLLASLAAAEEEDATWVGGAWGTGGMHGGGGMWDGAGGCAVRHGGGREDDDGLGVPLADLLAGADSVQLKAVAERIRQAAPGQAHEPVYVRLKPSLVPRRKSAAAAAAASPTCRPVLSPADASTMVMVMLCPAGAAHSSGRPGRSRKGLQVVWLGPPEPDQDLHPSSVGWAVRQEDPLAVAARCLLPGGETVGSVPGVGVLSSGTWPAVYEVAMVEGDGKLAWVPYRTWRRDAEAHTVLRVLLT